MKAQSQTIDHLGIVAGVMKDIGLVELINNRIPTDGREEISTGEAIAGMIINGLGFSDRPMTLTPQFFQNKALDKLFREGVEDRHFNRFKLGRALDRCHAYGCDALFAEISLAVCKKEGVDCRFNSEDTTTFSLTGEYEECCDEHTIRITHGYSKDHRPDLKQAVLELLVSQDGGIPLYSRSWSGNQSDSIIFRERAQALVQSFKNAPTPRYLIGDCKLYAKETVEGPLMDVPFITRIPSSIKRENEVIKEALQTDLDSWEKLDDRNCFKEVRLRHYQQEQRWMVISSKDMKAQAKYSVDKTVLRERVSLEKALKKIESKAFSSEAGVKAAIEQMCAKAKFHHCNVSLNKKKKYKSKGRPTRSSEYTFVYYVEGNLSKNEHSISELMDQKSCYVIATSISGEDLSASAVIDAYKGQNRSVERGFRFLKDPLFFVSSLFVKKTERIMAMLMIMTLALLVYSIAERQMRQALKTQNSTLPNQIKKEISNPTLRWIFQLMIGISFVKVTIGEERYEEYSGLTELHRRIICCFPEPTAKIYGLAA